MNYDERLSEDQLLWKKKATNKAKLINREIRKILKENISDIYIPCGRVYYDYETECGESCGDGVADCDNCNNWGVSKIEVSAILDIYYKDKCYMLIIEANDCYYIEENSYDKVKYEPGTGDAIYFLNGKNIKPKYICDYFNNIRLVDYLNDEYDDIFSETKVNYRNYINRIIEIITK